MKEVSIYIQTNFKGLKKSDGKAIFILEYKTDAGTCTKTKEIQIKDSTVNNAEIESMIQAVSALKEKCKLLIHTDNKYIYGAFENKWIDTWRANNYKSAKGKEVANRENWEKLLELLNGHEVTICFNQDHEYKSWMKTQLK